MLTTAPSRRLQSYRHEAFVYDDAADFTATLAPFVVDGLDRDEAVMVALIPEHEGWLRDALGDRAAEVAFVDMSRIGGNPARIIPAWRQFLDATSGPDRPARGIGEPIWAGRRPEELLECQLHEALLNVAIDPEIPFWLMCPYAEDLGEAVLEEAHRSHPVIVDVSSYAGSVGYQGRHHVESLVSAELAPLGTPTSSSDFTPGNVDRLYGYTRLELYVAGVPVREASDLAAAVHGLALSSLHRGATKGHLSLWTRPGSVVCQVADEMPVSEMMLGREVPSPGAHDGLWNANQACDLVQARFSPEGTTVRLHRWL